MTQTVGYYCDECRTKYVQHKCRDGLPCLHNKEQAIYVWAKAYGRGGEQVYLRFDGKEIEAWLRERLNKDSNARYRSMWQTVIEYDDISMLVGEWLRTQPDKVVRAFMNRWDSHERPPDWREHQLIPAENIEILTGRKTWEEVYGTDKHDLPEQQ